MMSWVLILFVHVGAMGDGNSNALTNVPGFATQAECEVAGKQSKKLTSGTVKSLEYVCVQQTGVKK